MGKARNIRESFVGGGATYAVAFADLALREKLAANGRLTGPDHQPKVVVQLLVDRFFDKRRDHVAMPPYQSSYLALTRECQEF